MPPPSTAASQSLWLDQPGRRHLPATTDASYDVVVVGGGITGLLTALHFAHAGRSVAVLEGRQLGQGTTGHTTAKVTLLQGTRLMRIVRRNGVSVARAYLEANREGQAWLRRFCLEHEVPFQVRPAFTHAVTRVGELRARAELAAGEEVGLDVRWDPDPGLPFPNRGAVRLDDQFQLHPMELLAAVAAEVLLAGGVIHESSRVDQIRRDGEFVLLHTEQATLSARTAVLATSMPIGLRGGWFARLQPGRSYASALRSSWIPPGMYLSADNVTRSLRSAPVDGEELLLVGGNGHVTGRGPSTAEQLGGLLAWAQETFPGSVPTHTWSAQDQKSLTELPYVGPITPGDDSVLVATGYDKWGFPNAAAAALLLSKTVLGGYPEWGTAMRSWTARELGGLPQALRFNAGVGAQILSGYLKRVPGGDGEPLLEGSGRVHLDGVHPVAECRVDGQVQRVSAVCTHLRGIVRWNDAERSWDCPLHGSRFGPDGEVLEGPATQALPPR